MAERFGKEMQSMQPFLQEKAFNGQATANFSVPSALLTK